MSRFDINIKHIETGLKTVYSGVSLEYLIKSLSNLDSNISVNIKEGNNMTIKHRNSRTVDPKTTKL